MAAPLFDNAPVPMQDRVTRLRRRGYEAGEDPLEGLIEDSWIEYFNRQNIVINNSPTRVNSVTYTNQSASIAATDFSGGALSAGFYRISYYARITQAASTSSSLTVTFSWTENGVALSVSGAAITGNTITSVQSGTHLIQSDASSPISVATTYASVGASPMKYELIVTLEAVLA